MGCPYCGGPIPPKTGRGRNRIYCSEWCCKEYGRIKWWRLHHGLNKKMENCKNCGRLLKYNQTDFCSDYCMERERTVEHHDYQIAGINKLRFAILKQAKQDGVLDRFMKKKHFYQLYPELTPDQLRKGESI